MDADDAAAISECLRLTPDEWERLMNWSMSAGRFDGLVEMHSMTRFDTAGGTRGLSCIGVSILLSSRKLLSPFLFTKRCSIFSLILSLR